MSVYEERIMKMISFAGAGRTKLVEAMRKAAKGNYDEAYQLIDASDEDILKCHKEQTELLFGEANNDENNKITVLLIHAMDQVMDTMNMRDMVREMINLVKGREEEK